MKVGIAFRKKMGKPTDVELLIQMVEKEPATSFDEKLLKLLEDNLVREGESPEKSPAD